MRLIYEFQKKNTFLSLIEGSEKASVFIYSQTSIQLKAFTLVEKMSLVHNQNQKVLLMLQHTKPLSGLEQFIIFDGSMGYLDLGVSCVGSFLWFESDGNQGQSYLDTQTESRSCQASTLSIVFYWSKQLQGLSIFKDVEKYLLKGTSFKSMQHEIYCYEIFSEYSSP